jgi:hypothetical protein
MDLETIAVRRADEQVREVSLARPCIGASGSPCPFGATVSYAGAGRPRARGDVCHARHYAPTHAGRLVSVVVRLPASDFARIHALHDRTKVPLSVYYREAVADLLAKYEATP